MCYSIFGVNTKKVIEIRLSSVFVIIFFLIEPNRPLFILLLGVKMPLHFLSSHFYKVSPDRSLLRMGILPKCCSISFFKFGVAVKPLTRIPLSLPSASRQPEGSACGKGYIVIVYFPSHKPGYGVKPG